MARHGCKDAKCMLLRNQHRNYHNYQSKQHATGISSLGIFESAFWLMQPPVRLHFAQKAGWNNRAEHTATTLGRGKGRKRCKYGVQPENGRSTPAAPTPTHNTQAFRPNGEAAREAPAWSPLLPLFDGDYRFATPTISRIHPGLLAGAL